MLLDQTDFLSVGVLGLQGVGKSTLLSLLAGNNKPSDEKSLAFKPQSRDVRDVCSHQTMGVDLFVTSERMILLDTQVLPATRYPSTLMLDTRDDNVLVWIGIHVSIGMSL